MLNDEVKVEVKQKKSDKLEKTIIQGEIGWKIIITFLPSCKSVKS